MHDEVHAHEPEARGDAVGKSVPAVEHDRHVVEPVQKNHVFLLQHQKHGVEELRELGHDEEGNPHADGAVEVPLARIAAHGREKAVAVQCAHEVRHRARGPEHGKYGQDEIPCGKGSAQPKGSAVAELLWEVEHDAKIKAHGKDRDFRVLLQVLDPRLASEVGFKLQKVLHERHRVCARFVWSYANTCCEAYTLSQVFGKDSTQDICAGARRGSFSRIGESLAPLS